MAESDLFVDLINERHSTNDIEEGYNASFGEYFNKVIKYGIKLGLKDHAICIALFTHSSLWEKQNTNSIPLIEWKEKDWKIYFEQLDSISTVPPAIKKDEVLQSSFQIAPSTPSTIPQKNLSITLGTTDQVTPKSTLNQSSILSLSNNSTPVKIISSLNFVNSQKKTSESKQEFFEANDNVVLKNLLTNAGNCVHLEFFNLDNKIGYCYGFTED
uniref:Uncharacterized protein n=1 Tax=Strongyloides papillosus TaxID=174720 RepID=A0A0N5CIY8_STREA